MVHVAIQEQEEMSMNPDRKAQIEAQSGAKSRVQSGNQVKALIFDKAPIEVPA